MSKILFGSIPAMAHINPMIPIAQTLLDMGHSVKFASHPELESIFKKADIPFIDTIQWGELLILAIKMKTSGSSPWSFLRALRKKKSSMRSIFVYNLEKEIKNVLYCMDQWRPDACVFDGLFYPGIIAAEICSIPFATSCVLTLQLPSKDYPLPFNFGFSSQQTKMSVKEKILYKCLMSPIRKMNNKYVDTIRRKYNLQPIDPEIGTASVPYSHYLYFVYTTSMIEFKRSDLPPYVYYIGPSASSRRGDQDIDFPWDWLEGKTPIVYFTMGTVQIKKKIINKAIKASRNAPWKLVVGIGNYLKIEEWPNLPGNILLRNYVPQLKLVKKINLIVSVGGTNTVNEALSAGVPLILIPQSGEQFDTSQQVVETGAGLRLNPGQISVKSFHDTILNVLNTPSYFHNAQRVASDFANCNGSNTAARLIEKLAEVKRPLLRPSDIGPTIYSCHLQKVLNMI
jgi:zeaxanthin glucosyltransferase